MLACEMVLYKAINEPNFNEVRKLIELWHFKNNKLDRQRKKKECKFGSLPLAFFSLFLQQKRMKATEDRIKLFLLHSLLLNTLPLKYRAQTVNANLLDRYCKESDGHIYPFQEVSWDQ